VEGSYAYVADQGFGLQIFEISDPSNPAFAGSFDTPDGAYDVFVAGSYAFVADWYSGLQIIDISDPSNPAFAGSFDTPGYARGVFLAGSLIYLADEFSLLILRHTAVGIEDEPSVPAAFSLSPNYPNPFNARTTIEFSLPDELHVRLEAFDITGKKVATVVDNLMNAGHHQATWDAAGFGSGIYFIRLSAGNSVETRKTILLK
jgi:hypothetical protein